MAFHMMTGVWERNTGVTITKTTPAIVISAPIVRRNVQRLAAYAGEYKLNLRPLTKTHKSTLLARLQIESGAVGLTVAKVGEAKIMATVTRDVLMAYPAVDAARCTELAQLARDHTLRVGIDSNARVAATEASNSGSATGW